MLESPKANTANPMIKETFIGSVANVPATGDNVFWILMEFKVSA
jgi:hypothetical protein